MNSDSSTIEFSVLKDLPKSKIKEGYSYYWYSPRKIIRTETGFDGKVLHGQYKEFYLNQQLMTKGNFRIGCYHGAWRFWNQDGSLSKTEEWRKGRRHGKFVDHSEDGETVNYFYKGKETTSVLKKFLLRINL